MGLERLFFGLAAGRGTVALQQAPDHAIGLLVEQGQRHPEGIAARIGLRGGTCFRDDTAIRADKGKADIHVYLVYLEHRVDGSPRTDDTPKGQAGAELLRGAQRGVGIIAEMRIDLRLRDLLLYLVLTEGTHALLLQTAIDALEMQPIASLIGIDPVVSTFGDQHQDAFVFQSFPARG